MTLLVVLQKYVQHLPNCDVLQPMWHKGPCDCGLAELLREDPQLKAMCGQQAQGCPTCGDTGIVTHRRQDGTIFELGGRCGCEAGVALRERESSEWKGPVQDFGDEEMHRGPCECHDGCGACDGCGRWLGAQT